MCGLVGILSPRPISDLPQVIGSMNQTLNHRGPDQSGQYVEANGKVALGHKRLSILDLTHGQQPMTDHDQIFTLVFNGEIYNHAEIKKELVAKGHPIQSRCDTEMLLYAFKEWGSECLHKFRGMFAFAIYDHRNGSIFIARDRLGIKPLYYGFHDGAVLFGSECKAILEYPGFNREMDLEAMSDYFSLMYVPAPKSIYKQIRKLPAGHWMKISAQGDVKIQEYWDLEFSVDEKYRSEAGNTNFTDENDPALKQAEEEILSTLDESVSIHMESDVPLGAFLSGGVDSAAVVALMAKHSKQPINTNTIGFSNKAFDETAQAKATADFLKTQHHEFRIEPEATSVMEKLAWHYDEPFADSSMIPTYYVCEMARKNVTVALSGDGGDENFAGYRRYFHDQMENKIRSMIPSAIRRPAFGMLGALYPKADWLPQKLRAKTLLTNLSYDPLRGYFTSMSHILPPLKSKLLSHDVQSQLGHYDSISAFQEHWNKCKSTDALSRIQYLDVKTYLVEDILTKVDRASMAVSLEVRVPVLDHKFIELAARMPSHYKLRGRVSKFVFKESLKKILPNEIFSRPKTGFSIPLRDWLKKELKDFTQDHLLGKGGLADSGLFQKSTLEVMLKEHQSGLRNHDYALFSLLSFALWKKKFQDNPQ